MSQTERLKPLTARAVPGDEVAISRSVLEELYDSLGEAVGAVEKLNTRIVANSKLWICTEAIFSTGKASAECPKAK
ncbi:hypothetical protein [Sphingomonas sp. NFR15]|uniref:hypothetical protein n=1 Tax=Sphingomonas sp. NFR15 TaxID=1566282 RepID=UPI000880E983|nr:hypothetical protein [Sphingomonas sp. NFR15]SDA14848.1 hypothetical protein SAMN03159340_00603 [Sphingomonas sp. NFR15]